MTVVGSTLFFTANDGTTSDGLWKSDGSAAGTVPVKAPARETFPPSPASLTAVGGKLFFRLDDEVHGPELWVSDGSELGTKLLKDIRTGTEGSLPDDLTDVGGTLYFTANDGSSGTELWKSDGTPEGTVRVKDLVAGIDGSSPQGLTAGGALLFFVANDGTGLKLWMSNGTEVGTRLVEPSTAALGPRALTFTGGTLYYSAEEAGSGRELYAVYPAYFGDCTPPVITTCPAGVTVEATKPAGADVSYSAAKATDDSGTPPTVSYSHPRGSTFPVGDNTVTVTATDAAGNSDTCSFIVAVKDSKAPTITCPANMVRSATGEDGVVVDYPAAQATDTISSVTLSYTTPSGSKFPVGDHRVQVTASDASGNTASCTFDVKVNAASGGDSGCGCTSGFAADAPWLLLGLFAPLMARRRRSSR